jgi:D-alanyl-lipoteichoic acid acyltransferase DltB (MBOAT superfamily)
MLFQTWTFAIFFILVYALYLPLRHTRLKLPLLLTASYVFYACWNPLYLLLLAGCTVLNFYAVVLMRRTRFRRFWFAVSLVGSLGALGFFKYAGFLTQNLDSLLAFLGTPWRLPAPDILLPVGISFFTFQAMTYTIEYYRGNVEEEPSLIRFATFVSLFPQLAAGPIQRAGNLLPQLHDTPPITRENVTDGLSLFLVGLFKKVALADYLSLYTHKVYAMPESFQAPALLLATVAFAWQIYFDFSGYTDMARGVALIMGYRLTLNFNNPYLATDLGDFWRRWHISLSSWYKDYVYIPLGGNRRGQVRTYVNMALTMVISGLWHGAAWTFVIWGALHAFGRVLTRELERTRFYRDSVPRFAKQVFVFAFVTFAWIFFRAASWHDACLIVSRIFTTGWGDPAFPLVAAVLILSVWAYQFICESGLRRVAQLAPVRVGLALAMIGYLAVFAGGGAQPFIYFQF